MQFVFSMLRFLFSSLRLWKHGETEQICFEHRPGGWRNMHYCSLPLEPELMDLFPDSLPTGIYFETISLRGESVAIQ